MPHLVLVIPEVVSLIINQLDGDRRSLGRCARTCTTWSDLALNLLWRDLAQSADPLRKLLPFRYNKSGDLPLGAVLHERDIHRFLLYSRRVHRLQCHRSRPRFPVDLGWNFSFVTQIAHLWQEHFAIPFPALSKLEVDVVFPGAAMLPSLMAPKLRHISIVGYGPWVGNGLPPTTSTNGQNPITQASTIKILVFRSFLPLTYLKIIPNLPALDTVDFRLASFGIDPGRHSMLRDFFRELSTHTKLRSLFLPLELYPADIPQLGGGGFSSLRALGIHSNPSVITHIIDMLLPIGCLSELHLGVPLSDHHDAANLEMLMDQISTKFHSSLRVISISTTGHINLLPRMLEMKALESVECPSAYITVPLIESMASTWAQLTLLKLSSPPDAEHYETFTLHTMSLIASSLPRLKSLHFFYAIPDLPDISTIPSTPHGLVSLSLISRFVLGRHPLALLLDKIFPSLQNVSVKGPLVGSSGSFFFYSDRHDWSDVAMYIREAQSNRTANQNNSVM